MSNDQPLPADARIGHVHLRVSDLDRSIAFYRDVIGFTLNVDGRVFGVPAAFLAAGGYHHHLALNTFESAGASPAPRGHTGLDHLAIVYPDRPSLARAIARVFAHGGSFDSGRDHGATLSAYLKDPDGNGIELYFDRPRSEWFDESGRFIVKNELVDVTMLLRELSSEPEMTLTA
jgi:catechol 2,3-dioxygenase